MRCVLFYHSLISDWNHGNAHFLRGIASELLARGHQVSIFEPADGWSLQYLKEGHGEAPIQAFFSTFPELESRFYDPDHPRLKEKLNGADLVIVHEWNDPDLVRRIGEHRLAGDPRRPYVETLPGIPTIRPFEALACGIPMISAPWPDAEGLFRLGKDYLQAADGAEMIRHLKRLLAFPDLRRSLAHSGRETILSQHTCGHRVGQLMNICAELGVEAEPENRALYSNAAN